MNKQYTKLHVLFPINLRNYYSNKKMPRKIQLKQAKIKTTKVSLLNELHYKQSFH